MGNVIKSKDAAKDASKDARSGAGPLASLLVQSFAGCVLEEKSQSKKDQNIGINVAETELINKSNTVRYRFSECFNHMKQRI